MTFDFPASLPERRHGRRTPGRFAILLLLVLPMFAQEPPPAAAPTPADADAFAQAVFFGRKFADMNDYTAAYDQFAKAEVLKPDHPAVLYDMAVLLAKGGRWAEAQTKVDRYLQLYPAGAEKPLVSKLQLELAFQRELQKKRQGDEDYVELFNRARFLYGKGDLDGALKLAQQAEQQRPTDPAPVYNEAVIFEKRGEVAKAVERFHRYSELESDADAKTAINQRVFALDSEIEDMRTKIVCPFCGFRLPIGAGWCPHCWHGPYFTSAAVWNARPCTDGASATRAMYFAEDRFKGNESLPCLFGGTMLEALRYAPAKQKAIQDARKSEGWTYNGEIITGRADVKLLQGTEYLERVLATSTGEALEYAAHKSGDAWLLDREDVIIDGQKYTNRYTFDASGHIVRQQVDYQNAAACNHLITMTADYGYTNDALTTATIKGGYDGWAAEGSPKTDWQANVGLSYDANGRVTREELAVMAMNKMYQQRPIGAVRDEVSRMYPSMRTKRPLEGINRGDYCATSGTNLLGNPIDLRPFYAMSPNLAIQVPYGVVRTVVTFTYPESYKVR
jgi:tetratricopeptide (TPR) repeat protein